MKARKTFVIAAFLILLPAVIVLVGMLIRDKPVDPGTSANQVPEDVRGDLPARPMPAPP
jgi:hypothetical protein